MKKLVIASMCILLVLPCVAFSQVILPPLVQPESVVVVPSGGADVYLVPGVEGLYFFRGSWFRLHNGYWFKSPAVHGRPWAPLGLAAVPNAIITIPPTYILNMPPHYHRIRFNDFRNNWKPWEQSHHWGNQGWYRDHRTRYWGGNAFHSPSEVRRGWQGRYGHDGVHVRIDRGRVVPGRAERVDHGRVVPGRAERVDHGRVDRGKGDRDRTEHGQPVQYDRHRGR
jgi:hypothetical protein